MNLRKLATNAAALLAVALLAALPPARAQEQGREEEVVANLAGGRVILLVANDVIIFATIEQPAEGGSIPPRVASLDATHIGVLLGAAEWLLPSEGSKPIRLDRSIKPLHRVKQGEYPPGEEPDLELIGEAYLEGLRPFATRLHHKIALGADEPLFEMVVIGYGPDQYGPEVWLLEYRVVQDSVQGDYMQTRLVRPRMTQLYPPEKHQPHTLVEVHYPGDSKDSTLLEKIQGNDLAVLRIARSDDRFLKVLDKIQAGKANSADPVAAADFLRAIVVPLAGNSRIAVGQMAEQRGVDWLVPPVEPVEKAREDKDRPPEAPSLIRKP